MNCKNLCQHNVWCLQYLKNMEHICHVSWFNRISCVLLHFYIHKKKPLTKNGAQVTLERLQDDTLDLRHRLAQELFAGVAQQFIIHHHLHLMPARTQISWTHNTAVARVIKKNQQQKTPVLPPDKHCYSSEDFVLKKQQDAQRKEQRGEKLDFTKFKKYMIKQQQLHSTALYYEEFQRQMNYQLTSRYGFLIRPNSINNLSSQWFFFLIKHEALQYFLFNTFAELKKVLRIIFGLY